MTAPANPGVHCVKCGCRHCPVLDTRRQGKWTTRRRRCRNCGFQFRTREQVIEQPVISRGIRVANGETTRG